MRYRLIEVRIHPKTRRCRGYGVIEPGVTYLIGKPKDCASFQTLTDAAKWHAVITGSSADFVHVITDRTAPMHSGRVRLIGTVTADGDKQGSARGSQVQWGAYDDLER